MSDHRSCNFVLYLASSVSGTLHWGFKKRARGNEQWRHGYLYGYSTPIIRMEANTLTPPFNTLTPPFTATHDFPSTMGVRSDPMHSALSVTQFRSTFRNPIQSQLRLTFNSRRARQSSQVSAYRECVCRRGTPAPEGRVDRIHE